MIDVKLWSLEKDGNSIIPSELESLINTETEQQLEDLIVKNPNLLMDRLKLVGRQTPTATGGYLDLLGVDKDGYLVVFELKRGKLTRDAVTQVIDYSSDLADLDRASLCEHISDRSGANGIDKIDDFEDWYQENIGNDLEPLDEPPKMILVGLGYDENVKRMVNFLSNSNLNISLITFYGFQKGDDVFLAKQVEVSNVETREIKKDNYNKVNNEMALNELIQKTDVADLFSKASDLINKAYPKSYAWSGKTSRSFGLVELTEAGKPSNRVYSAIYIDDKQKRKINFHIQQRAIAANKDFFEELLQNNKQLKLDKAGNMPIYIKTSDDWGKWEPLLTKILNRVYKTWEDQSGTN